MNIGCKGTCHRPVNLIKLLNCSINKLDEKFKKVSGRSAVLGTATDETKTGLRFGKVGASRVSVFMCPKMRTVFNANSSANKIEIKMSPCNRTYLSETGFQ